MNQNRLMIEALNSLTERNWPSKFTSIEPAIHGSQVGGIRGVLIAGDLVESSYRQGSQNKLETNEFLNAYPLCGSKKDSSKIKYPVYEGFGNHDFVPVSPEAHDANPGGGEMGESIKSIISRNQNRQGLLSKHTHGHYSWRWDNVHFVNINMMSADEDPPAIDKRDTGKGVREIKAFKSLTFLEKDLERHVGDSNKPIIVMLHYPIVNGSRHSAVQKEAFKNLIRVNNYNLIAVIHGHSHQSAVRVMEIPDESGVNIKYIPVLDLGAHFYNKASNNGRGFFTMVRVVNNTLEAVNYSWMPDSQFNIQNLESDSSWYVRKSIGADYLEVGTPGNMTVYQN